MNTILTDDERRQAIQSIVLTSPGTADQIARAIESAVLAKLARQEPVAWMCSDPGLSLKGYSRFSPRCEGAWNIPIYTHPAPQKADRQRVPEGWKLVPVEPTQEMCKAAVIYANGNAVYKNVAAAALEIEEGIYGEAYTAMLAAAPEAPAQCDTPRYCASVQRCTADDERRASTPAQASAVDECQPLTDEQIVNMANPTQHLPDAPEGWVRFGFSRRHLVGFARSIERAHGIGGEGKR